MSQSSENASQPLEVSKGSIIYIKLQSFIGKKVLSTEAMLRIKVHEYVVQDTIQEGGLSWLT
jgi:hypothetical protein